MSLFVAGGAQIIGNARTQTKKIQSIRNHSHQGVEKGGEAQIIGHARTR